MYVLSCCAFARRDNVQDTIELVGLNYIRFIGHKRDIWVVLHNEHPH
jgi:hypothetical protein